MRDFLQHVFLVLTSLASLVGIPLPFGMPPLPEDPTLLRVAPADCNLFVEWFGAAEPAKGTTNRTERLAAEPEVRQLVQRLADALRASLAAELREPERRKPALPLLDVLSASLQRPGCLFVQHLQPFAGGLVLRCRESAAATVALLDAGVPALLGPPVADTEPRTIGGVKFTTLPLPTIGFLGWAAIGDYVAIAAGEGACAQIAGGLQQEHAGLSGNAEFQKLLPGCKVERPMLRTFVRIAALSGELPGAEPWLGGLGLRQAQAALAESGLSGQGFAVKTQLLVPKPEGVLALLRAEPLSQDDLALIPADATVALALRASNGNFENLVLELSRALGGDDVRQDWEQLHGRLSEVTGVRLREELIGRASDCLVAWSSPAQGSMLFSAACAAVPLLDGKAFGQSLDAMWLKLAETAPNKARERAAGQRIARSRGYLEQFEHQGRRVFWVDLIDPDFPFGLAWSSTASHFLFGLSPQAVRSALDDSLQSNFDRALARQPLVARRGKAVAMLYLDLRGALMQAYAPLLVVLQTQSHAWQRDGFDFTIADVPRLQALVPHLGPEFTLLEPTDSGWLLSRTGTLPVIDPLLATFAGACLFHIGM